MKPTSTTAAPPGEFVLVPVPASRVLDVYAFLSGEHPRRGEGPANEADLVEFVNALDPVQHEFLLALARAGSVGLGIDEAARRAGFSERRAFGGWFGALRRRAKEMTSYGLPVRTREARSGRVYFMDDRDSLAWLKELEARG